MKLSWNDGRKLLNRRNVMKNRKKRMIAYEAAAETEKAENAGSVVKEEKKAPAKTESTKKKKSFFGKD